MYVQFTIHYDANMRYVRGMIICWSIFSHFMRTGIVVLLKLPIDSMEHMKMQQSRDAIELMLPISMDFVAKLLIKGKRERERKG